MSSTVTPLWHLRRLDDALREVDAALAFWARYKRRDLPPNGWYTESNIERSIRGPRSTAPSEVPDYFVVVDQAVARCKPIERRVLKYRYVWFPENSKEFQRKRAGMSEGMWDRLLRSARNCVARNLLT